MGDFFLFGRAGALGADASKRRKHTFTDRRLETLFPPAAPSGFPLQCFWPSVTVRAYAIHPYKHHMYGRIAYTHKPKTFPLQSLSHARPEQHHVSRRRNIPPRPDLFPAPRTPRPDLLSRKWEHCPHLATDMQPLTRLVAVPTHHAHADALRLERGETLTAEDAPSAASPPTPRGRSRRARPPQRPPRPHRP